MPVILTFDVLPINMTFSNLRRSLWRSGLRKTLYWLVNEKTWPGLWWILASTAGLLLKLYIVYLFICLKRWAVQSRWNALRLMSSRKKTEFLHVHHTFWYISWPSLLIRRKHVYGECKHSSERNRCANFLFNRLQKKTLWMKIYRILCLKVNSWLIVGFLLRSDNLLAFVWQHTTLQQFVIYAEHLGGLNNSLKKCTLSQGKSESAESGNFSHKCLERNHSRTEKNAEFKRYILESPGSLLCIFKV